MHVFSYRHHSSADASTRTKYTSSNQVANARCGKPFRNQKKNIRFMHSLRGRGESKGSQRDVSDCLKILRLNTKRISLEAGCQGLSENGQFLMTDRSNKLVTPCGECTKSGDAQLIRRIEPNLTIGPVLYERSNSKVCTVWSCWYQAQDTWTAAWVTACLWTQQLCTAPGRTKRTGSIYCYLQLPDEIWTSQRNLRTLRNFYQCADEHVT